MRSVNSDHGRTRFVASGALFAVALVQVCLLIIPGTSSAWERKWKGDAGFSIVTPDDCGTVPKGTVLRIYGDTNLGGVLQFGTFIAKDAPSNGSFTVGGQAVAPAVQLKSVTGSPATLAGGATPPTGYGADNVNRMDTFWPGAPFLINSSYGNGGSNRCTLVSYGALVRKTMLKTAANSTFPAYSTASTADYRRIWGMRLDLDVSSLTGSASSARYKVSYTSGTTDVAGSVGSYSDSSYWDFGSSLDASTGKTYVYKAVAKCVAASGGKCTDASANTVEVGLPDGNGVPQSQGFIELPPGAMNLAMSDSKIVSASDTGPLQRGLRGSIVSAPDPVSSATAWWFVASPSAYSQLVYAVRLKSPLGEAHGTQDGGLLPSPTQITKTVATTTTTAAISAKTVIPVKAATGISAGNALSGAGVPAGTTVVSVSGTNVTVSQSATIAKGAQITFTTTINVTYPAYQLYSFSAAANINTALKPADCNFYDPLIHQDMPSALTPPQTFPMSFSANKVSNASTACNTYYGSYRIPTFWPLALSASQNLVDQGQTLSTFSRRAHTAATSVPTDSGRLVIKMWPGKYLPLVNSWLAAGEVPPRTVSRRRGVAAGAASVSATAAAASPSVVMSVQPNYDIACEFLVPTTEAEWGVQQLAAARAEAAVLAAQESDNANRILTRAQQAKDAAAAAYDRRPTSGNRKALALANAELAATQARYGRIAALLTQRQEASIAAQRAACGEGRTSWTD